MLKFKDLKFESSPEGVQRARQKFGPYELSVILEPGKKFYEAAIFDEQKNFIRLPGIHINSSKDDVIPYLNEENVSGIMLKLYSITGSLKDSV